MRSVVDKLTVQQVSLRAVRFSSVSIIPPILHTQLKGQTGEAWKRFSNRGALDSKLRIFFLGLRRVNTM